MEETNLEKSLKDLFASIKVNFSGRMYHKLWRYVPEKESKKKSESYPWFCATEKEMRNFYCGWSFFYRSTHNRFDCEYTVNLYFFVLAQHDPESKSCLSYPFSCVHTVDFIDNFFCKPQEGQIDTISTLIKNGWFNDYFQISDNRKKIGKNMLLKITSSPKVKLGKEGYFVKAEESKYSLIRGDAMSKSPIYLQELCKGIEDKIKDGLLREKITKDAEFLESLKKFLAYEYK